jgi:hypothetical protein
MKVQEKWLFCYWDEPIFEKEEVKETNNKKTKDNGTTSNTNRKKDSDQTKRS